MDIYVLNYWESGQVYRRWWSWNYLPWWKLTLSQHDDRCCQNPTERMRDGNSTIVVGSESVWAWTTKKNIHFYPKHNVRHFVFIISFNSIIPWNCFSLFWFNGRIMWGSNAIFLSKVCKCNCHGLNLGVQSFWNFALH